MLVSKVRINAETDEFLFFSEREDKQINGNAIRREKERERETNDAQDNGQEEERSSTE